MSSRQQLVAAHLRDRPLLLVGMGVVFFSVGPVLVAASDTAGAVLSFWRLWVGTAFMGALTALQISRTGRRPDRTGWTWAVRCGGVFAVHQVLFMVAIKRTSVVDVTLMQLLQPVLVGVLAAVLFGERPGTGFRVWSLVSMAGAAVVVLAGASGPSGDPGGVALAAGNVGLYAVYFVWSKQARDHIDTTAFLFGVLGSAAVAVSAWSIVSGQAISGISGRDVGIAVVIAIVPGGLGHFVTTWPLARVPANVPPVMQLAIPFLAGAMAWLFLDQRITLLHLVGGLITVAGVAGALLSSAGRRFASGPDPVVVPGD